MTAKTFVLSYETDDGIEFEFSGSITPGFNGSFNPFSGVVDPPYGMEVEITDIAMKLLDNEEVQIPVNKCPDSLYEMLLERAYNEYDK